MYDLTVVAQTALQEARRKVTEALTATIRDGRSADEARHLTCLNYALMSAEFTAAEAVNAARVTKELRWHEHSREAGAANAFKP